MSSRNIVVAMDPEKHWAPLHLGARLARMLDAPLVVVSVFPDFGLVDGPDDERRRTIRDQRSDLLELVRGLPGIGAVDVEVVSGRSPARLLQKMSEREDTALVVVGSTMRGALRRIVPGSVVERLASGAACPVAVAPQSFGAQAPEEPSLVGVAYDGSDESSRALDAGAQLARLAGAPLRLITVNERIAFGAVSVGAFPADPSVGHIVAERLRQAHDEALAGLARLADVEGVFEGGHPADVLTAHSRELDLLVAGSRGYGPLGAVLLGGTTHDLMRSSECPLLITPRGRGLELGE